MNQTTVDGWNPAPVDGKCPIIYRVSAPSQVVQDFSHQQYQSPEVWVLNVLPLEPHFPNFFQQGKQYMTPTQTMAILGTNHLIVL